MTDSSLFFKEIADTTDRVTKELLSIANPQKGSILVVGCSSSEVVGNIIGHGSNEDVAKTIFETIYRIAQEHSIYLAAQCCEHLNRAIVVEEEVASSNMLTIVNAIPQVKAGGGFATSAYNSFNKPVLVEHIQADIGIDIGQTIIGMHLKPVAVPVRVSKSHIGKALITCARTRPKYIGGERAIYK